MFAAGDARVNFDADFSVGGEGEVIACEAEEVFDLWRSQVGGSATAPVELDYGAIFGDAAADAGDFALQDFEVGGRDALVFLDDDVAGAEEAEALAEGDVHVERDGGFGCLGLLMDFFQVGRAEGVVPDGGGGVTGGAGAGAVVAGEEFFADAKFFAHVLEGWICEPHKGVPWAKGGASPTPTASCRSDFWPVSMKSWAFSTGVCWRMPWPRLRMWPVPPSADMASCVARRISSGGAKRTAGSTFPCRAMRGPSFSRSARISTRQSTLRTFAPERATAARR